MQQTASRPHHALMHTTHANGPAPIDTSSEFMTDQTTTDGEMIVGGHQMKLAHVCVQCGKPTGAQQRRSARLHWSSPWWLLTCLISPFLYIVLWLATRRHTEVEYTICDDCYHEMRSKRTMLGSSLIALTMSLLGTFLFPGLESTMLGFAGLFTLSTVALTVLSPSPIKVKAYKKGQFYLTGAHPRCIHRTGQSSPMLPAPSTPEGTARDEPQRMLPAQPSSSSSAPAPNRPSRPPLGERGTDATV